MPTGSTPTTEASCSNLAQFSEITGYEKHAVAVDYDVFLKVEQPSSQPGPLPSLDLQLRDQAVAVDAGEVLADINDGFRGKAPDLGAYEVGTAIPTYGPRPTTDDRKLK
jgi:hypothetical protein